MNDTQAQHQIDQFFAQFSAFSFKTGDTLIKNGEHVNFIYYLKSGVIKQVAVSAQGQESTITLFKPGAFFPLVWAVNERVVPYDFKATANGSGWKAPREAVITFLRTHSDVSFSLVTRLLSALEGMSRKVEYALQASASQRVGEALLTLAYRFGKHEKQAVRIDLHLTHQELAHLTGLTRETITRELKTLRDADLIRIEEHHFYIPKLSLLEESLNVVTQV